MKILAFVDLHGDSDFLHRIVKRGSKEDVDLLVCAGDFTQFESGVGYVLKELNSVGKPVLMIPGNHENPKTIERATQQFKNIVNLHGQRWQKENYLFLGYGTGGFAHEDGEFRKVVREWRRTIKDEKIVMVLHGPPHKTKLDQVNEDFTGNIDYRMAIQRLKPRLVLCGHLHENAGKIDFIDSSQVINPGYEGMVIEL